MKNKNKGKKIMLKVYSRRSEIPFTRPGDIPVGVGTKDAEPPDVIELVTEGWLHSEGGKHEIKYEEGEASGIENSQTTLAFDDRDPDSLIMMRRGGVNVTMVFSPGLRHICRYDNPVMPLELTIMTHSIDNKLFEGGKLEIVYTTELAGASRARTWMTVSMSEIGEE